MALAIQTDLEPIGGVQRPAPAKRQREPRHRCTLCGSRKVSEDFPLTTGDIRKHVTCTQCLEASFTQPAQWQELGLQEPKKGGTVQQGQREPQTPQPPRRKKTKVEDEIAQVTCRICAEDKPCTEFIPSRFHSYTGLYKAMSELPARGVPYTCLDHVTLIPQDTSKAICEECLSSHLATQLHSLGAERLTCIDSGCTTPWSHWALNYLSDMADRDVYDQQLFDAYWRVVDKWECPAGCDSTGMCMIPHMTGGYPHIECYGCKKRFCGLCRVPWHIDQTCQQFRNANPDLAYRPSEEDEETLRNMVEQGARRCPRCQMIILKAGGCDGMQCDKCFCYFDWKKAELVAAPVREDDRKEAEKKQSTEHTLPKDEDYNPDNLSDDDGDAHGDEEIFPQPCEADIRHQQQVKVEGRGRVR